MSNSPVAQLHLRWTSTVSGALDTDGDMSQAVVASTPTCCDGMSGISYQVAWAATGTPIGTLSVEVCNKESPTVTATSTDWVAFDSTLIGSLSSCHPAGTAGSHVIVVAEPELKAKWVRLKYTRTSGSGTLNAWVYGS